MEQMERMIALMQAVRDGRKASKRHKLAYGWNPVDPQTETWDWENYLYRLEPDKVLPSIDRDEFWISVKEHGGARNLSVWFSLEDAQKYSPDNPIIHVSKVSVIPPLEKEPKNDGKSDS